MISKVMIEETSIKIRIKLEKPRKIFLKLVTKENFLKIMRRNVYISES